MKICRDIPKFVFIVGVGNTADKLFTGVNDIEGKLDGVVVTGDYYCRCHLRRRLGLVPDVSIP
jgi:hypothetical protein